jgi:hypothetical protein
MDKMLKYEYVVLIQDNLFFWGQNKQLPLSSLKSYELFELQKYLNA